MKRNASTCRAGIALLMVLVLSSAPSLGALDEDDTPAFQPPFSVSDKLLLTAADAADLPTFQLRARVISSGGKEPQGKFIFCLSGETLGSSAFQAGALQGGLCDRAEYSGRVPEGFGRVGAGRRNFGDEPGRGCL